MRLYSLEYLDLPSLTQVYLCTFLPSLHHYTINSGHARLCVLFFEYVVNFHVPICSASQFPFIWDTFYSLSSLQIKCLSYLSIRAPEQSSKLDIILYFVIFILRYIKWRKYGLVPEINS